MATTIFVSPGVYTKEQDFSVFASRIGITRLGLAGLTQKGPAFKPIRVSTSDEFLLRFGGTHPDYALPYVANSFLAQANELTVTRVLGTGKADGSDAGFENSNAWLIKADYATTYSGTVTYSGVTFTDSNATASTTYNFSISGDTALTVSYSSTTTVTDTYFAWNPFSGNVSTSTFVSALAATSFSGLGITVTGGAAGTYIGSADTFSLAVTDVEPKGQYSGATLAILRSKRNQISGSFYFSGQNDITYLTAPTSVLGNITITGTTGPFTTTDSGTSYTVSLDETKDNYIVKILGKSPKIIDELPNFYVERIFPHFVREAASRGDIKGIYATPDFKNEASYTDYKNAYTYGETPWIVSRVIGGKVRNLFKFRTISDGDAANTEIKISISNIDIVNYTFDVIVRRFSDTDAEVSATALERFSNVTLDETQENYIAKMIGTYDEEFPIKSSFIALELAESIPANSVPAGFRGYSLRGSSTAADSTPANFYYKTGYLSGDSIFKTYLGLSEKGYTSVNAAASTSNQVKSLEADMFEYAGGVSTGKTTIKGFHLENTANSTEFVSGSLNSMTAYTNISGTLIDKNKLKFTVAPYGGFDGWDKYQMYEYPYEMFVDAYQANVYAFKSALDTFENPEEVDINLFATPGIDFSHNYDIIKYGLDIIEGRTDALYIIDAPRVTVGQTKGTPEEVVNSLEATGVDSNYACTFWPWIQIVDTVTGKYTYQPPTLLAVKAIALTDSVANPWYAPAGFNRGIAGSSVIRTDVKLNKNSRDTLYRGRINPIASYVQQGIVIQGQKTLQARQSALDRINVRRLLLQVRRLVAAASLTLLFEPNDQTLRDQFLAKVEPILLQIQNQRGLTDFRVVMDDSNNNEETIDRNTLVGKIQLKPTRTAEFIDLTFQVLPTGANFEDF